MKHRYALPLVVAALLLARAAVAAAGEPAAGSPEAVARVEAAIEDARATFVDGDAKGALKRYREILRNEAAAPGVPIRARTRAYAGIMELAPYLGDTSLFTTGNLAARSLVGEEAKALGADSADRVPGLIEAANWYYRSSQPAPERKQLEEVVRVLGVAYGERHASLAVPLVRLANSYITDEAKPQVARAALDRAAGLALAGAPDEARTRSAIQAALGDHAVVFGAAGSGDGHYREAWRVLAASSPEAAVREYGVPMPLHVNIPAEPFASMKGADYYAAGSVTMTFTVRADGHLDDVAVLAKDTPVATLPTPVVQAFRRARYRPRLADGAPVATTGEKYVLNFGQDAF
jgi:outer membrane biosynthesis protein TonB